METIPKSTCEKIGFIRKTHGVGGDVVLEYDSYYESSFENIAIIFIELEGLLVPFFIEDDKFRFKTHNTSIIKFDTVKDETYAKRLVGKSAYISKDSIRYETEQSLNFKSLIGYWMMNEQLVKIGEIISVDDYAGNIVLTISRNNQELLIPFHEDHITSINNDNKTIIYQFVEGILSD